MIDGELYRALLILKYLWRNRWTKARDKVTKYIYRSKTIGELDDVRVFSMYGVQW